jgi:hypothetical protein
MYETFDDFFNALDVDGQAVFTIIAQFIEGNYPDYKPVDIRNNQSGEWTMNYRKKPKVGKSICTLESLDGKLRVRFCFLSSMSHEFLLRQSEFSNNARKLILKQVLCSVGVSCHNNGGNTPCIWQQHFWINHHLTTACPYPWVYFDSVTSEDTDDILLLIRLQAGNMRQDSKDIKGGTYAEENKIRCGEVKLITLCETVLDTDEYHISNYTANPTRLENYAALYHLVPLGGNSGAWFCRSDAAILENNNEAGAYSLSYIPQGTYAAVTVSDPMTFSANRAWNFICSWIKREEMSIAVKADSVCFVKFYTANKILYMDIFVPLQ